MSFLTIISDFSISETRVSPSKGKNKKIKIPITRILEDDDIILDISMIKLVRTHNKEKKIILTQKQWQEQYITITSTRVNTNSIEIGH